MCLGSQPLDVGTTPLRWRALGPIKNEMGYPLKCNISCHVFCPHCESDVGCSNMFVSMYNIYVTHMQICLSISVHIVERANYFGVEHSLPVKPILPLNI